MTKYQNIFNDPEEKDAPPAFEPIEKWWIGFACISFFPLFYLVGRAISSLLS